MLSVAEREEARLRKIREQMREQDAKRFANPERERDLERVWVVYQWMEKRKVWWLAGFRRRRKRRKQQTMNRFFAKVRRRLGIDKGVPIKLVDLQTAALTVRRGRVWRELLHYTPPHRQTAYKPLEPIPQAPIIFAPKAKPTKLRKDSTIRYHKTDTKFIALGRRQTDRTEGYHYLGPLHATDVHVAMAEARDRYPLFNQIRIVGFTQLSTALQRAVKRGGKIFNKRILWPEPVGLDEILTRSYGEMAGWGMVPGTTRRRDVGLAIRQVERDLKHAVKHDRTDDVTRLLAILSFLYTWEA